MPVFDPRIVIHVECEQHLLNHSELTISFEIRPSILEVLAAARFLDGKKHCSIVLVHSTENQPWLRSEAILLRNDSR